MLTVLLNIAAADVVATASLGRIYPINSLPDKALTSKSELFDAEKSRVVEVSLLFLSTIPLLHLMILTKYDQDKAPDAAQNMAILTHCKRLLHGGRVQVGPRSAGGF